MRNNINIIMSAYSNIGDFDKTAVKPLERNDMVAVEHCSTIYAAPSSAMKKVECDVLANTRFEQAFNSLSLPGSVTLQIPNISIIDSIVARLEIPSWPADVNLPRAWGYLLVDRMDLRVGSSITLTFSGETLLHDLLAKCKNASSSGKRSRLFDLGGQARTTSSVTPLESLISINVPIISSMATDKTKLPFDLGLLNLPAQVVVYFKSLSQVCNGTGIANVPTALSSGRFLARQMDLKDNAYSMKNDMLLNPNLSYTQPFIYNQSIALPVITSSNSSTPTLVSLTGFRYGTVEAVAFYLVRNADLNPAGANARNPFNTQVLNNIRLLFNGQVLYNSPGNSHELLNLALEDDAPNMVLNALVTGTNSATFVAAPVDSYFYDVNFSQYKALSEQGILQSGLVLGNNTLSLQFTTPNSNLENAILFVSYRYGAGCKVSNGGSQVDFVF